MGFTKEPDWGFIIFDPDPDEGGRHHPISSGAHCRKLAGPTKEINKG
jgi:hypothetical protein